MWLPLALLACAGQPASPDRPADSQSSTAASDGSGAPSGGSSGGADTGGLDTGRIDTSDSRPLPLEPCTHDPDWTVGLIRWTEEASSGYTLFGPEKSGTTYLIDRCGREVHRWERELWPGKSVRLTDDGLLLRTEDTGSAVFHGGGRGGRIVALDWDGSEVWRLDPFSDTTHPHHDAMVLPSGNVLLIRWELISEEEALEAGRDPSLLWTGELWVDTLVELDPNTGEEVWAWRVWDHLVQDRDPTADGYGVLSENAGRIDVNATAHGSPDWTHMNSLDYDPERAHILVSVHGLGEIWVIDHGTTTEEATGPAGELLYRWGHPANHGASGERRLFGQHHATWLDDGDILVYNNGDNRPEGEVSSIEQLTPPWDGARYAREGEAWGPEELSWSWSDGETFSISMSGAQRLQSGATFVTDANYGRLREISVTGEVVWSYLNPVVDGEPLAQGDPLPRGGQGTLNTVFRAVHLPMDHPGLVGRDLTPGETIER